METPKIDNQGTGPWPLLKYNFKISTHGSTLIIRALVHGPICISVDLLNQNMDTLITLQYFLISRHVYY